MTNSFINVPDTGPRRIRTIQETIAGNVVEKQVVQADLTAGTTVGITTLPSLPAGTNNIGDVDVLTIPPDPSFSNAAGTLMRGLVDADRHIQADVLTMPAVTTEPTFSDAGAVLRRALVDADRHIQADILTMPSVSVDPTFSDAAHVIRRALVDADRHIQADILSILRQDMLLRSSTTVALGAGAVFTGASFSTVGYGKLVGSVIASHASATNGFEVQQSHDNTNWDIRTLYTVSANATLPYSVEVVAPHARIVYTNGATAQTMMRLFIHSRVI